MGQRLRLVETCWDLCLDDVGMVTDVELVPGSNCSAEAQKWTAKWVAYDFQKWTPKSPDSAGLTAGCKDGICQQSSGGQARSIWGWDDVGTTHTWQFLSSMALFWPKWGACRRFGHIFLTLYSNPFSTGHIACQVGSNLICTQEMGAKFVWERISSVFRPPFFQLPCDTWEMFIRLSDRLSDQQFPGSVASGSRYMEPGPVYQPSAGRAVSYGAQSMGSSMMGGLLGSATSTLQVQLSIDWNHNGRSEWFMMTMTMTIKNSEWTDDHWWLMNKWWCVTMKPIVCGIMLNLGGILISRLWLYVTT